VIPINRDLQETRLSMGPTHPTRYDRPAGLIGECYYSCMAVSFFIEINVAHPKKSFLLLGNAVEGARAEEL
jgi:hypothetical protein